jgi:prepilin-type N-terminal cleavage/methylation domain-containing protein
MPFSLTRGFTLIELMVVIAILTLTGATVFVQFFNARDIADVEVSSRNIEALLAQAQSYGRGGRAFSTSTPVEGDTERFDRGYGVYMQTGSSTAVLYGGQGDAAGSGKEKENKYTPAHAVETLTMQNSQVTEICVKATPSDPCVSDVDELHILFRRGQVEVMIMGEDDAYLYAFASTTITSGKYTKSVVVWNTGLVYTE